MGVASESRFLSAGELAFKLDCPPSCGSRGQGQLAQYKVTRRQHVPTSLCNENIQLRCQQLLRVDDVPAPEL